MRVCARCGAENPTDAQFCVECGALLADRCRECGRELPASVRFCPACGSAVQPEAPPDEERKLVTVLFADVVGSTALGARLDPETLREVTDAYFQAMREELEDEGGTVEKFIGDAVMAVFGVPAAHEDDPTRAIRAAVRMRRRLADLNRELERIYGVELGMRIGVNTGEVLAVMPPRPEGRMVTGDAVNVASRLEQAAATGQVLVSERTARAARGVQLAELGPVSLRGKDEAIYAFEVVAVRTDLQEDAGALTPMVGRKEEMQLLRTIYRRSVAENQPSMVTVYGDAGVGKTRMLQEFQTWTEATTNPPAVARGRCLPYGEGVTYWPLAEILKRRADVLDSDPPAIALQKIRDLANELLSSGLSAEPERAAAALAVTVGIDDPASPLRDLEPHQVRSETVSAWHSFFTAIAGSGPAIVVVEDLHWADPALLDLLEQLADRIEAAVLFLCSARRELTTKRPGWGSGSRNFSGIVLEPLGLDDSKRLLLLLLEDDAPDVPSSLVDRILERAGGNPFFIEQIVRHLAEEGVVAASSERLDEVEIPDTVQAVLAARIDLLEPVDKQVLRSAAVVGKEFWSGSVARLLERRIAGVDRAVEDALSRLQDRGLIAARLNSTVAGEREFIFRHILTRDVAYESIPRRDLADAHARVAGWIEDRAGERRTEFADLLAYHYAQAYRAASGDVRRDEEEMRRLQTESFGYALLASEQSRSKLALDAAERQAELALSVSASNLDRSRALEALGDAYFLGSEGDRAWECLKEALDIRLSEGSDPKEIAQLCAKALEVPTRGRGAMRTRLSREEATPYLEAGLAHAGTGDSEELARLLIVKAFWPASLGEGSGTKDEEQEALSSGEQAAAMALRLGRPDLASAAQDGAGQYFLDRGLYGRFHRLIEKRLQLSDSLSDPTELGDIYAMASWCSYHIGRYRDAEVFANAGVAATRDAVPTWALYCLDWRAVSRCRLGDWDACLSDVDEIGELLGDRREQPPGYASDHLAAAAFVHEVQGDVAAADRLLQVVKWLESEEERPSAGLAVWKALVLARRGSFDDARHAVTLPDTLWHGYARGIVMEAQCEILAQGEEWEEAEALLPEARRHAEEAELLALPCFADRLEGLVLRARGDRAGASLLFRRAYEGFERLEAAWEAARTALVLAETVADHDGGHARGLVERAVPVLRRLRSLQEVDRAQPLRERFS